MPDGGFSPTPDPWFVAAGADCAFAPARRVFVGVLDSFKVEMSASGVGGGWDAEAITALVDDLDIIPSVLVTVRMTAYVPAN
jgi:hypothetical protein